ncbi:MAG: hypothetical protein ACK2TU_04415, partial [Anaerolineales bacterium]
KSQNEAYCRGIEGKEYLFYFTDGGEIRVDISLRRSEGSITWQSLDDESWVEKSGIQAGNGIILSPPGRGNWLALIQ